jgi:hypothetical protein
MKTTIEIADPLFEQAKREAARRGTTLRALVEQGLRETLKKPKPGKPYKFRPVVFHGDGMRPEVAAGGWPAIRDLIYEGHGA